MTNCAEDRHPWTNTMLSQIAFVVLQKSDGSKTMDRCSAWLPQIPSTAAKKTFQCKMGLECISSIFLFTQTKYPACYWKGCFGGYFLAQNCLWMQRVWLLDLRLQIQAVCASRLSVLEKFDDRVLRISGAEFCHSVAHVYLQTWNSASFTVEIATKFMSLMSKKIEMKSHFVI